MTIRSGKPMTPNWYGSRHNRTIVDLIGMPLHLYLMNNLTICSSAPAVNDDTNWSLGHRPSVNHQHLEYDPWGIGKFLMIAQLTVAVKVGLSMRIEPA